MPAKKPRPEGEKPQRERFKDAAKEAGAGGKEEFERAFKKIVPEKKAIKATDE